MRRAGTGVRRVAAVLALATALTGGVASTAWAGNTPRDDQWYVDALHMPEVWQTATGAGVTVAVIDSGFKGDSPDQAQLLPGKDLSGLPGGVNADPVGHGTGMASIIAGTGKAFDGKGAIGFAPGAKILPIKVNTNGDPSTAIPAPAALKQIADGITYAVDQGAKVISISQAVQSDLLAPSDISYLQQAVNYAIGKGDLIVAGAGNSAQDGNMRMYPSVASGVAAIAGFDESGTHTTESEYGPQIALAAPGQDVISLCTDPSGYCKSHGTSVATALTAAAAADLWQVHPTWTGNQILRVLINSANKPNSGTRSDYLGFGNISPRNAIHYTGDPGPADVNPLIAAGIDAPAGTPSPLGSAPASAPSSSSTGAAANPSAPASGNASAPAGPPVAAKKSSSSVLPLIVVGAVVALLVIGGVVFLVTRRKRATPPPAGDFGYPMPHQPPSYAPGAGQPPYPPQQPPAPGAPYQQAPPPGPYNPPQG
ncbi:S8 family serine peptidase [Kitasatospora sp. LaBMicrA B282]|uniref:S8 family serine peptidase n=1 Tax=Kitasatospora sp. LaBMicrA B282 TaxID=3420949 RepID=UPI003D1240C8